MILLAETEYCHDEDDFRQGDVIQLEYPEEQHGPKLGVLLNADCDLANGKTDGTIAYLPLYPFGDYLSFFWLPGHLATVKKDAQRRIVDLTHGGDTGLADLDALMEAQPVDRVAAGLKSLPSMKRKDQEAIDQQLAKLEICLQDQSLVAKFSRLCGLQENPVKHARSQIERAKASMGDDHFFLSEIVGQTTIGFVVRMRRIYSISEDHLFRSVATQRSRTSGGELTAFRFARLTPFYRFKVIQLFAQQFARVGLPDELTKLSALAIDDLAHQFAEARR